MWRLAPPAFSLESYRLVRCSEKLWSRSELLAVSLFLVIRLDPAARASAPLAFAAACVLSNPRCFNRNISRFNRNISCFNGNISFPAQRS